MFPTCHLYLLSMLLNSFLLSFTIIVIQQKRHIVSDSGKLVLPGVNIPSMKAGDIGADLDVIQKEALALLDTPQGMVCNHDFILTTNSYQ